MLLIILPSVSLLAFVNIIFVIMIFYLFFSVGWEQVTEALEQTPLKLAQEEIVNLQSEKSFLELTHPEQSEKIENINIKYENSSRINPFKTSHVEDFNFWYFLIGIIGVM